MTATPTSTPSFLQFVGAICVIVPLITFLMFWSIAISMWILKKLGFDV